MRDVQPGCLDAENLVHVIIIDLGIGIILVRDIYAFIVGFVIVGRY